MLSQPADGGVSGPGGQPVVPHQAGQLRDQEGRVGHLHEQRVPVRFIAGGQSPERDVQAAEGPHDRPDLCARGFQFRLTCQELQQEIAVRAGQVPGPGPDDGWLADTVPAQGGQFREQRHVGAAPARLEQVSSG